MWLSTENGLLTEIEQKWFAEYIRDFEPNRAFGARNFYNQSIIENKYLENSDFIQKLKTKIEEAGQQEVFFLEGFVNHVCPETNKNDPAHKDLSPFATITFLNDDFEGGELEVVHKNIKKIEPELYKTVIIEGAKIDHRVMPVTKGNRYTFVTFWQAQQKIKNTFM